MNILDILSIRLQVIIPLFATVMIIMDNGMVYFVHRLLNLLNYYSNNAIINETTVFTGKVFATQLEDINLSKGCFTGRNFSINVGSYDEATAGNTTIDRNAIGSKSTENTTASVYLAPPVPDNCINTGSSVYRLAFYTFLKNTLFQSPQQEKEGYKLGSIIISVGGSAIPLADKLQFTFQVSKVSGHCNLGIVMHDNIFRRMLKVPSLHSGL